MSENYEKEILQLRNNGAYISETNSVFFDDRKTNIKLPTFNRI